MGRLCITCCVCRPACAHAQEVIRDEESARLMLVQEFAENGVLMAEKDYQDPLPPERARKYFRDLLSGLEYLQFQLVVHRDIKPSNALLAKDDSCKISDFGLATLALERNGTVREVGGSPAYMAPEMYADVHAPFNGFATDIWALGATLLARLRMCSCACSQLTSMNRCRVHAVSDDRGSAAVYGEVGAGSARQHL